MGGEDEGEDEGRAGKPIANRQWTTVGKEIGKDKRISSTFLEGMTPAQVDNIISEAFVVRDLGVTGTKWTGTVSFNGNKITIEGILRNNEISSAYIINIE